MNCCTRCSEQCTHKLCMNKVPIFSFLNQDELLKITQRIGHNEYRKGEILFREGEEADSLVIVNVGSVKAYRYTPDGREQILYVFSEGDFFGERNLFGSKKATFTAETLEQVRTCTFRREDFNGLLREFPGIAVKIIEELEDRMERLETSVQSMGVRSVDSRISSLLLDFSRKFGTEDREGLMIHLPLSREGIANYLGIARETVSRKLGQLENDGMIRNISNKSILITDLKMLELSAGKTE